MTRFFATLRPSCAPFMSEWRKCIPPNTRASTISFSMSLNLSYVRIGGDTGAGGLMVWMRIVPVGGKQAVRSHVPQNTGESVSRFEVGRKRAVRQAEIAAPIET